MEPKNIIRLPTTSGRVPRNTHPDVNRRIREQTLQRLEEIGFNPDKIDARLAELEREWDIERTLTTNAAAVSLLGLTLGATVSKRWFVLPALVSGFLFQHSVQGWCPPLPFFRNMGIRTQREIDHERTILKARRGDLAQIQGNANQALRSLET